MLTDFSIILLSTKQYISLLGNREMALAISCDNLLQNTVPAGIIEMTVNNLPYMSEIHQWRIFKIRDLMLTI